MRRLAPASSVRECSRRERESGSRARGTGRDRLARDAAAARPVAPPDQPRPDPRRRRPPRIVGSRARARDRLHQSTGARRAGAGRGARHRLHRRRPRRPVRVALRAAHRTRHVAPGRALRRRGLRGRRAGRMAAHPGRPLSLRRVDAAPAGPAFAFTLPLALHRAHPLGGHVAVGWLAWLVFAVASGALVGTVFLALTRQRSERADVGFVLLATLLFGAGIGYAADLSPFLVCALASALIVNASPRRQAIRQVLTDWEHPIYAIFLVFAGALLTLPTPWVLIAVPLLVAARAAAKWVAVRYGSVALSLAGVPPHAGLGTIAQGGAAIAMGLNFFVTYRGEARDPSGALLTTIVLGVAVAQLAAPPLMALALRTRVASPVAPAPLTPAAAPAELSANATADWPR